jgi:hypothetical protein
MSEHDWREHALGPPSPIPDWLYPQRSSLGSEDLRVAPSTAELRVIARLLDHERIAGQALVTMRAGSPWLEIDVAVPALGGDRDVVRPEVTPARRPNPRAAPLGLAPPGVYRYAIWRYTAKAYRVDVHGAVEDDPIDFG